MSLTDDIRNAGGLSFEDFQRLCLYDSRFGYYTQETVFGPEGDFTTVPLKMPFVGQALAAELLDAHTRHPAETLSLVEVGPGKGDLSLQVIRALLDATPTLSLNLSLVEISSRRRDDLQARFASFRESLSSRWRFAFSVFKDLSEALEATCTPAHVFSNELVDAFPALALEAHSGDWMELWITFDESGEPIEGLRPLTREGDCEIPIKCIEGTRVYCHPSFHEWMLRHVSPSRIASWIVIDYGSLKPSPVCRAYKGHQLKTGLDLYRNPGKQDLTTDVNFTDLERWGKQIGFQTTFSGMLCEWLTSRFGKTPETLQAKDREYSELWMRITNPFDAGGAFRVLVQQS